MARALGSQGSTEHFSGVQLSLHVSHVPSKQQSSIASDLVSSVASSYPHFFKKHLENILIGIFSKK